MSKGRKSILNALAALTQMLITSLVGLVFNKTILSIYGSDYNGINSTVSQIVNTLMILEGGFSLASNVALFEPIGKEDYLEVNGILSATRKRFLAVGGIAFGVGVILVAVYPFTVTSEMPKWMIAALMMSALIPVCYNLAFNMKYRVLILTDQKEYIISLLTAGSYLFGNGIAIILMRHGCSILAARLSIMFFLLVNYWIIALYCKNKYPRASFKEKPNYEAIKGTKSVIILKLTSVVYSSVPIVAISTISGNGALLASVYAVYRSIISVVRDTLTSVTNAPRLAFGALFSEGRSEETKRLFNQYELISCIGISIIVGVTCLLLLPFVVLYTNGIQDIQYKDNFLAIIMLSTVILEILHIPSGQIIQMKGEFDVSRRIQSIACIILVISMIIGRSLWGLYGVVLAVLLAAIALTIMEVGYTSIKIFKRSILSLAKNMMPCIIICVIASAIGMNGIISINSYLSFIGVGIVATALFTAITLLVYYIISKDDVKAIVQIFRNIVTRNKSRY